MKVSDKRKQELYSAIHEPIMKLRIELQQEHKLSSEIDHKIAQTTNPIWREVKAALNINE